MLTLADNLTVPPTWWTTLTSSQGLVFLAIFLACLIVMIGLSVRLRQISAPARRARAERGEGFAGRAGDESGVATIEFVLVFPFLLTTVLLLLQTVLLFTGLFYVNYAAYSAARSAIVYIPVEEGGMETNTIVPVEGNPKYDRISSAAAIAVIPVSGREAGSTGRYEARVAQYMPAMQSFYQASGQQAPGWVNNLLEARVHYAVNHTFVTLQRAEVQGDGTVTYIDVTGQYTYAPKEAVVVEVRHEMALTVPFASRLFAATSSDTGNYTTASRSINTPGPEGLWTAITARAVLTNEGIDRHLPERPRVPRRP